MNRSKIVSVRDISFSRNIYKGGSQFKFKIIENFSLDIYKGQNIGLYGRNGIGKSTLLKIINGSIYPDIGSVVINNNTTIALLAIGVGFDDQLNGYDNCKIVLGLYNMPTDKKTIEKVYEFSEIGEFFYQPVKFYSTGMRSRLGFSIITILNPDLLLIDEVLSVGDEGFMHKSKNWMFERLSSGTANVIVSHDKNFLVGYCDKIIEM